MRAGRLVGGWMVSSAAAEGAAALLAGASYPDPLAGTLLVAGVEAVLLAGIQAWVLRGLDRRLAGPWCAATLIATVAGRLVQAALAPLAPALLVGAIVGVVMALPQLAVLRRHTARAPLWLLVRSGAWTVALPLLLLGGNALAAVPGLSLPLAIAGIVGLFAGVGAFVGGIEGSALVRLLAQPVPDRHPASPALRAAAQ